jgi:hypothetical protein
MLFMPPFPTWGQSYTNPQLLAALRSIKTTKRINSYFQHTFLPRVRVSVLSISRRYPSYQANTTHTNIVSLIHSNPHIVHWIRPRGNATSKRTDISSHIGLLVYKGKVIRSYPEPPQYPGYMRPWQGNIQIFGGGCPRSSYVRSYLPHTQAVQAPYGLHTIFKQKSTLPHSVRNQ